MLHLCISFNHWLNQQVPHDKKKEINSMFPVHEENSVQVYPVTSPQVHFQNITVYVIGWVSFPNLSVLLF